MNRSFQLKLDNESFVPSSPLLDSTFQASYTQTNSKPQCSINFAFRDNLDQQQQQSDTTQSRSIELLFSSTESLSIPTDLATLDRQQTKRKNRPNHSQMDGSDVQYATPLLRQATDNKSLHSKLISHGTMDRSTVSFADGNRPNSTNHGNLGSNIALHSPHTTTNNTEVLLSMVNETQPSYRMKTAGKTPLSPSHLLSLVDGNDINPHTSSKSSTYSTTTSKSYTYTKPSANPSSTAVQFDPDALFEELNVAIQQRRKPPQSSNCFSPTSNTFKSTTSNYYHHKVTPLASTMATTPKPMEPIRKSDEAELDRLTSRLVHCMRTGKDIGVSSLSSAYLDFCPIKLHNQNSRTYLSGVDFRVAVSCALALLFSAALEKLFSEEFLISSSTMASSTSEECSKCGESISSGKACTALDQTYHVDCFTCIKCGEGLAGKSFYAVDQKPYCEKDYLDTLEKCSACNAPITEKMLRATGKPYHPSCFTCSSCNRCLDGVPFTVDSNGLVHCVNCFHEKYAPRCAICSKPIVPEEGNQESVRIVALDRSFHVDCYRCEDCGLKLTSKVEGHECYPLDNHILCKDCNINRVRQMTN
ncbi:Lipoma-preferred partner [Trichinella zimbabwensis]|uniref:Lipoma-preferred partner n=1 Tax=Trichinella zimbabwensis TaxID=268475 RepID=A0A0V1H356_9BILA|nr:Lipoma-preferred partner [Trichinella zimbabwensis]